MKLVLHSVTFTLPCQKAHGAQQTVQSIPALTRVQWTIAMQDMSISAAPGRFDWAPVAEDFQYHAQNKPANDSPLCIYAAQSLHPCSP